MLEKKLDFDAIVVGGGPAGSFCTAFLAKKGYRVLLLDKQSFPRDKTCGDGISGKSIKLLKELGLDKAVEKAEHRKIFGVVFSSPKGELLEVPIPENQGIMKHGYCCRRMVFDNLLFQNAKKLAAETIEGFEVKELLFEDGKAAGVSGIGGSGKEQKFSAQVVVGADGANSVVARKAGLWNSLPEHRFVALRAYYDGVAGMRDMIELHFLKSVLPGYFWIFPLENGKANVGIGMILSKMKKKNITLQQAMLDAIEKEPLFRERFKNAKRASEVKAWNLPLATAHNPLAADGIVLVGDAASLIDPFSGEGIGNALVSGKIAAETIDSAFKAKDFSKNFLKQYEESLWREIGREIKNSTYLLKMTELPWLFNFVVSKANRNPKIANFIAESLVNQQARQKMESPLFFIKALFS